MAIENNNVNFGFARHPGKILARELNARGMSNAELAIRAGTSTKNVSQIINGSAPISPEMAVKLEYVLGTPAHVWNNLQMNYQEALIRDQAREYQAKEEECAKNLDYAALRSIFPKLPDVRKLGDRIEALRRLFGVSSLATIFETDSSKYLACARRTNADSIGRVPDQYALISWLRIGEIRASHIECPEYDAKKLRKEFPTIKHIIYTMEIPEAWKEIRRLLLNCGVKIVAVKYLKNTYVNGAVRWIGDNPVIIMSDRNAYADIFWFSLMHEICHILKHGKKYACVAFEESVKCYEKPAEELEADAFAADFFIPQEAFERFASRYHRGDESSIYSFAEKEQIPYYIVVGRLCHAKRGLNWSDSIASQRPKVKVVSA